MTTGTETTVVDPDKIAEAAQDIQKQMTDLLEHYDSASQRIESLGEFWKGDAASLYIPRLRELMKLVATCVEPFTYAPRELAEYAVRYGLADKAATELSEMVALEVKNLVEQAEWASV